MKIICTLLSCSAVFLNSIGLSSQSEPPAEATARTRSRSPTLRQTFPSVLGYRFDDLEFIRLRPHNYPNRTFELRRYAFPPDKPIGFRTKKGVLNHVPTGEKIVLSTSNGDVCAILERSYSRPTTLRGMFLPFIRLAKRAKINMNSGVVEELTTEEIAECPVSNHAHVSKSYAVFRLSSQSTGFPDDEPTPSVNRCGPSSPPPGRHFSNTNSSLATLHDPASCAMTAKRPLRDGSELSALRRTFPNVLGYRFEDLEFIRLIPHNHSYRIYELRTYVFPLEGSIGVRTNSRVLNPIPIGDQIVLSTLDGYAHAILLKSSTRCANVRPIFTQNSGISERVKINMSSGKVEGMTATEITECPTTAREAITKHYRVLRV